MSMEMAKPGFIKRTVCPACGNRGFKTVHAGNYNDPGLKKYLTDFYNNQGFIEYEYLDNMEYNLLECGNCRLVFQEYIPNDALMYKLYEYWIDPQHIKELNKKDGYDFYNKYASEVINILSYFDQPPYYLSFFDFGMGWGKWILMAKAFGCDVYGTELSDERINYAKSNGIRVITWDEIPQHQFDFINTEQVFEHIPEPLTTMKHLSTALKPGGLIKISVPNGNGIAYKLRYMDWTAPRKGKKSLMPVSPLEHINCYRTESILAMAKECGLKQVHVPFKYIGFRSLKDMLQTLVRPYYYKYFKKGSITLFFKKA